MKSLLTGLLIAVVLFGGAFVLLRDNGAEKPAVSGGGAANVVETNGKQIITLKAKGGYQPAVSEAKAGVPTILRFETKGTFDCSSAVSIPSLGISRNLPPSGFTDVEVGVLEAGTLNGTCSMGMYHFKVNVQS